MDAEAPGPLLEARGVCFDFGGRPILEGIDLAVEAGEIVTLIGPNGSGKTTLVRALLGLIAPAAGRVVRRPGLRVGYVPQRLQVEPTLPLTVARFVAMAAKRGDLAAVAEETAIGGLMALPFQALSGGEAKRVLLARALARDPDLLVLDEPTANVDVAGQGEFYDLIRALRDRRGCGVLLVSHDLHLVMAATDTVVCLNGHVCCRGRPDSVIRDPEYLALFGPRVAATHGVYTHDHDHRHDLSGDAVGVNGGDDSHG